MTVNLPPTLSKSQVSSVRKNLKMQMLTLLRMPDAIEFQYNITTLLTDLGATQSEVVYSFDVDPLQTRYGHETVVQDQHLITTFFYIF